MNRNWLIKISIILTVFCLIVFTGSFIAGSFLIDAAPVKIGSPPSDSNLTNVKFKSKNGQEIRGWYGEGKLNNGAVILIHGIRSNRLQMLSRARFLQEQGIAVLLFDLQAHGESDGERISFGYYESQSAEAAVQFMRSRLPKEKVAVIGVSLGGAACLLGEKPVSADMLIIEEVYASIEEAIINRLTIRLGRIGRYVAPLLLCQISLRLGISKEQLRPVEAVKKVKCPIFIIGGSDDRRTLSDETFRIYHEASESKELWIVEGGRHIDLYNYAGAEYKQRVLAFMIKHKLKKEE